MSAVDASALSAAAFLVAVLSSLALSAAPGLLLAASPPDLSDLPEGASLDAEPLEARSPLEEADGLTSPDGFTAPDGLM
ncbi:hypothetical protein [Actinoplanes sp. NPDC020271]|uniref:hypothetical protein n=1 Tax=Actinoplanes sp. NPDC020271 TaxID=3363896 RepID=UPI0037AA082F